jgi:uncharacterized protein (TIGR00730 family)
MTDLSRKKEIVKRRKTKEPFRSAKEEVKSYPHATLSPQMLSPAYQLAFLDQQFLLRSELRPIRLQLELLKPEMVQQDEQIHSTVVVFGSARIPDPSVAKKTLQKAEHAAKKHPQDAALQARYKAVQSLVSKSHYYDESRKLARIISANCQNEGGREFVVVTGGGPGIMEAANRGAYDVNAKSVGLNIVLPVEQGPNIYISPELCFQFHYFAIRKMHFLIRARALVAFPGGYGTLDELFEALTLMQTKKISLVPVILFGKDFWKRVINFQTLVDEGTIDPEDLNLFQYVETAEEAWQIIADFYHVKTI